MAKFRWWTFGIGNDGGPWLKLGPLSFVLWAIPQRFFVEIHALNHRLLMLRIPRWN